MKVMLAVLLVMVPAATSSADFPLYVPTTCSATPAEPHHKVKLPSGIIIPAHQLYWDSGTRTLHVVGADPVRIFCNGF